MLSLAMRLLNSDSPKNQNFPQLHHAERQERLNEASQRGSLFLGKRSDTLETIYETALELRQ